ncbi:MAG TPA: hypothetical protein VGN57_18510 [Pirellulaceae bacterium]|jgi:hypothetical protein|nr:hypothetical protein [Pirellulaceae bacterium]
MSERSAEVIDREELDASAPPSAAGSDAGSLAGCVIVSIVILLPALLYFGFFAVVLLDELVFEANWFVNDLPEPALEVLRVIYAPLIWLVIQFQG